MRLYNSLPRGQDISNFPSLIAHQAKLQKDRSPSPRRRLPATRSLSEDVYNERPDQNDEQDVKKQRSVRENPLIKYASEHKKKQPDSKRKSQSIKSDDEKKPLVEIEIDISPPVGVDDSSIPKAALSNFSDRMLEKHVSFDSGSSSTKESPNRSSNKAKRLKQTQSLIERKVRANSSNEENSVPVSGEEVGQSKEETVPVELCDIEPFSGTVFRKVTVRRRRQDMRKMPTVDTGKIMEFLITFTQLY